MGKDDKGKKELSDIFVTPASVISFERGISKTNQENRNDRKMLF